MSNAVLDASAILAVLSGEAGAEFVASYIGRGEVSTVNLAEVASKLAERGGTRSPIAAILAALALEEHSFSPELALDTGSLRPATRHLGLSPGDRARIALAVKLGLPVVTADREWGALDLPIPVVAVRA
jgi:PIN domain nuclease of toxin-antitoxin system